MPFASNWTDEDILEAMHLRDNEGCTIKNVAASSGRTLASMAAKLKQIRDAELPSDLCEKPENKDGGMPERWWHRG